MEKAFEFMEGMRRYPLDECGEPLVSLREGLEGAEVVFSDTLLNDTFSRLYWVRAGIVAPLRDAAREMNERGWVMKIEDGYRSPEMQRAQSHDSRIFRRILQKILWELHGEIPSPDFMLRRLSALIATRCRVGTHISGSAVDISILDRHTGTELDRGGAYLEMSELTPMASPFPTEAQRQNRQAITDIMHRHGWMAYPYEFWHYSAGDVYAESLLRSGRAARYGAVTFDGSEITPLSHEESDVLLEPVEFYRDRIAAELRLAVSEKPERL